MDLVYNIDFELAGLIFILILYIHFCLYYSDQSVINKKFKLLMVSLIFAELMDVITAVTISYGSVIPVPVNIVANTIYFMSSFFLSYTLLQYVASYVRRSESGKSGMSVHRTMLGIQFVLLVLNMFAGFIFSFNENGKYTHGKLYVLVYLVPLYYICFAIYVLCRNLNQFKKKQIFPSAFILSCVYLAL